MTASTMGLWQPNESVIKFSRTLVGVDIGDRRARRRDDFAVSNIGAIE